MKITRLECIPYTKPSKGQQHRAIPTRPQQRPVPPGPRGVLLKMYTDEGIVGIGDAGMASLGYAGDTVDSIIGYLKIVGPALLLGSDPLKIELLVARMDRIAKYSRQAMAIVDCALHDVAGKKFGLPVYQLLGGKTVDKSPMGMIVTTKSPQEAAQKSVDALKAGFHSIKLKVGALSQTTLEEDLANLEAIREAIGYGPKLGIDANGEWEYYHALQALKKMEKFDLCMAEQPVPWKEIDNLARLRQKVGIPIAADESATDLAHLLRIIERDAADLLFIKLGKVGGIKQAQKWSAVAKAAGLPIMCGALPSSAFETAWQVHFLVSDEWATHMEHENLGVTGPVTDDIAKNVPLVENGYMYPPEGPGLGLELNEELLAQYAYKDLIQVIE
ncbi:MAG: mandelate racemase/muconate lactonizing enzyme family protein [Dehalococcoidales bacterium]|nr:mandelate racemase/muconate lactonizing enzyme family protein [Dehalococcoidales bacterium]